MQNERYIFWMFIVSLMVSLGVAIPSCSVGPDYSRPSVEVPAAYKSATTQAAAAARVTQQWWALFNDPILNKLEADALHDNPDLKAAVARIAQARAVAGQVKSQFYPQITFDPSMTAPLERPPTSPAPEPASELAPSPPILEAA